MFLLHSFFMWPIGLIFNLMWLREAREEERRTGRALPGVGCLSFMVWWCLVSIALSVLLLLWLFGYFASGDRARSSSTSMSPSAAGGAWAVSPSSSTSGESSSEEQDGRRIVEENGAMLRDIDRRAEKRAEEEAARARRSEPDPLDAFEAAAQGLLNEAANWEANGRVDTAKAYYEELIKVYKGTKAAEEGERRYNALVERTR